MRFSIAGTVYNLKDIEQLSLRLLLELQSETKDTAQPLDVATVQEMAQVLDRCKNDEERKRHPNAPWVLAVSIWASRRLAGEEVSFLEAIDFPMAQLTFLPEPADRKKAADPTPARRASARAAKRPAAKSSAKTSKKASTRG